MKKKRNVCPFMLKHIKKGWMIMRLCVVFVVLFVFSGYAESSAQNQLITLNLRNVSFFELFNEIHKQTGLRFVYNTDQLNKLSAVDVRVENKKVSEVLKDLFAKTPFTYVCEDDVIMLMPNPQQQKEIQLEGRVVDEQKIPLPGVNVRVKGVLHGAITDKDGNYRITLPATEGIVLIFSFMGMETVEIKYAGKNVINVVMKEAVTLLDEVVVSTGYQKIEQRHLTSAVTHVKMEDIMVPGINTIDKMLESHVPGLIYMQNSGQVGATPRLRIRGTSTILGTQEPLWVLDGIVLTDPVNVDPNQINDLDFVNLLGNAISGLNPNDIEAIDVLKDASATALYGTRAANGVIVITTKQGKQGAPRVSYSFTGTLSPRSRYTDRSVYVMNSRERIDYSREIIERGLYYPGIKEWVGYESALFDYWNKVIDFPTFKNQIDQYETSNTDWFDIICRDAFSHNHTVSLSGGSPNVKYYASIGYAQENGVLQKEQMDRYNAMVRLTINDKKFTGNFSLIANINEKDYTPTELGIMDYAYNTSRAVPLYNADGSLWFYYVTKNNIRVPFNIIHDRDNSDNLIKGSSFMFTSMLGYRFLECLKFDVTLSYNVANTDNTVYLGEATSFAESLRAVDDATSTMPFGAQLTRTNTTNNSYTVRGQLNFNKFLDSQNKHLVAVAAGAELTSTHYTGMKQIHRCYLPDRGMSISKVSISQYPAFGSWLATDPNARGILTDQLTNKVGTYATVSYTYDNRYTLNANMRVDASNKFGSQSNKRMLPIWSTSARWNMKGDIFKHIKWVDDVSLRASFGYQGNMPDNETPELIIRKGEMNSFFGEYESHVHAFPNPDLRWEKVASFNSGLDVALFRNKVRGSVSYYYKRTTNAFLKKQVSVINGVTTYVVNEGTVENQGFELSLNITPVGAFSGGGEGFRWSCDPQIGQVLNRLIDKTMHNKTQQTLHDEYTYDDFLTGKAQVVGMPLNSFYSYTFTHLDPKDGRPMFARVDEEDMDRYLDMESREQVFATVMEFSGRREPFIQGGVNNTFSYKRLSLGLNLAYSVGSKVRLLKLYPTNLSSKSVAPQPVQNLRREFVHRWRQPGDERYTNIPGLLSNTAYENTFSPWWKDEPYAFAQNIWQMYNNSSVRVVNGDYLKIQSINLRYSVPEKLCRKMSVESAYISLSGANIYTWSHKALKGQDAQSQSGTAEHISVPIRPTYTFNLNLTF